MMINITFIVDLFSILSNCVMIIILLAMIMMNIMIIVIMMRIITSQGLAKMMFLITIVRKVVKKTAKH